MGRLIDADAFKNFIENLPKEPNGTSRAYDEASILHFIDAQPTACNVEKVVAELERHKDCYEQVVGQVIVNNYDINLERADLLNHAIEIVRKGGAT